MFPECPQVHIDEVRIVDALVHPVDSAKALTKSMFRDNGQAGPQRLSIGVFVEHPSKIL